MPAPRIHRPEEAIVRPIVVGRCDLDTGYVRGSIPLATGNAIGHECIAEVVDLGDDVTAFKLGDRVIVSPSNLLWRLLILPSRADRPLLRSPVRRIVRHGPRR